MAALLVTGCGGGGSKTYNEIRATTLGQEMKDLDDACRQGALSEQECKEAKEKILKQYGIKR